jgi:outer membrane murein-binding lipoprotein Lpp
MKRTWWIAALVATLVLVGGCKGNHNQNSTEVRMLNAVADAEPLDMLVDDDVKATAVALGAASSYTEFASGGRDVKVRSSSQGTVLIDKSLTFASGTNSTLVAFGKRSNLQALVLADDTAVPSSGHFKVRVVGLSPDSGAVDLYVTGGDISASPATIPNIGYGGITDYTEGVPGSYRLVYTAAGTKDVIFQSAAMSFTEGQIVTLGIFPALGGKLVNGIVITSDSSTFLPNPLGRLKAVNAVPDSSTFNFKADGATLLSAVPFGGGSSYVTTAAGARTLQLESANVPGTNIATLPLQIDPARDYTTVAVNNLAQAQLVTFADDDTLPTSGFAKVRFVNAMVGSTTVDVLVNFASQATDLAYKSASSYYQLAAALNYTVTFASPGGVSVITTLTPLEFDAGAVYTVYLVGTGAAPAARLVRDR